MNDEMKKQMLGHLVAVLAVLGLAMGLDAAGMHAAAAAGAATIIVVSAEGSTRWRTARCARKG